MNRIQAESIQNVNKHQPWWRLITRYFFVCFLLITTKKGFEILKNICSNICSKTPPSEPNCHLFLLPAEETRLGFVPLTLSPETPRCVCMQLWLSYDPLCVGLDLPPLSGPWVCHVNTSAQRSFQWICIWAECRSVGHDGGVPPQSRAGRILASCSLINTFHFKTRK